MYYLIYMYLVVYCNIFDNINIFTIKNRKYFNFTKSMHVIIVIISVASIKIKFLTCKIENSKTTNEHVIVT